MNIPARIPPELVRYFDSYNPPGGAEDYHRAIKQAHETCPDIFWTPSRGGYWVVTRGEDLSAMLKDHENFRSTIKVIPKEEAGPIRMLPIEQDPPDQTAYRALINPWFTPRAIGNLEAKAREITLTLIEGFRARGECEFVSEFAAHLPVAIFMSLVDLPYGDREYLMEQAQVLVYSTSLEARMRAFANLFDYLGTRLRPRAARPGNDLLSAIATAEIDGKPIAFQDQCGMATLVLIGGIETVTGTLGLVAHFLANSPGHRRQLIDNPALASAAVEELLRRFGVSTTVRMVERDVVYKDIHFKAGDQIHMLVNMHGLDERCFDDPLKVDFNRKTAPHSAFSSGPHRCPGSYLARTELKVFLQEWLRHIPDFEMKPGVTPQLHSGHTCSFYSLPLIWNAE